MKCIYSDLRRAITGRWFLVAVFAAALAMLLHEMQEIRMTFDVLLNYDPEWPYEADWARLLKNTLHGDFSSLLLPALSTLPFASQPLQEMRSGAFRPVLFRSHRLGYIAGKTVACVISGMLVYGMAALLLILGLEAALGIQALPLIGKDALISFLPELLGLMGCGGVWACFGCAVALSTETTSAAFIAPLCLCYALRMIGTRFFPEIRWVNPMMWPGRPALYAAFCIAVILCAGALQRSVKKHV